MKCKSRYDRDMIYKYIGYSDFSNNRRVFEKYFIKKIYHNAMNIFLCQLENEKVFTNCSDYSKYSNFSNNRRVL